MRIRKILISTIPLKPYSTAKDKVTHTIIDMANLFKGLYFDKMDLQYGNATYIKSSAGINQRNDPPPFLKKSKKIAVEKN